MTGLDPEARALIDLARSAEDGSMEDRARVRRRIAAALGIGAASLSMHEALESGVKSSLAPLSERAASQGLAFAERASGEMFTVAAAAPSGGLFGISSVVLHAAAFLVGGALIGGAAWLAVDMREAPTESRALSGAASKPASVTRPQMPSPAEAAEDGRGALVPQPEAPRAKPIRPEDLPMLPEPNAAPPAATPRPARRATGTGPANSQTGSSLADEAREVAAVHQALREGRHALALSRLNAMDRRPGGALAEERLVARVLALCGLSRVAEAETVARQVQSVAPESPLLPRLGASCAKNALSP
jgi:hypothetical protein